MTDELISMFEFGICDSIKIVECDFTETRRLTKKQLH